MKESAVQVDFCISEYLYSLEGFNDPQLSQNRATQPF